MKSICIIYCAAIILFLLFIYDGNSSFIITTLSYIAVAAALSVVVGFLANGEIRKAEALLDNEPDPPIDQGDEIDTSGEWRYAGSGKRFSPATKKEVYEHTHKGKTWEEYQNSLIKGRVSKKLESEIQQRGYSVILVTFCLLVYLFYKYGKNLDQTINQVAVIGTFCLLTSILITTIFSHIYNRKRQRV
jgi:cell division protein FtsW (lipid II flippase)